MNWFLDCRSAMPWHESRRCATPPLGSCDGGEGRAGWPCNVVVFARIEFL